MSNATVPMAVMVAHFGVPVTVTRPAPETGSIQTNGIWLTTRVDDTPFDLDLKKRHTRKTMAFAVSATLPSVPLKSTIRAAEVEGGPVLVWRADKYEEPVSVDEIRVSLVQISDPY